MSRKYARPQSDIHVNPLHAAVLEAAEKGVDWKHVHELIATLGEQGLIDPAAAWDDSGRQMLGALMTARRGYGATVPEELLDLAVKLDPKALVREDPGGNTPVDYFLDALKDDSKAYERWSNARWWFTHAPKAALLAWTPKDRYGEGRTQELNGVHLLDAVLDAETECKNNDHSLLVELAGLGVKMDARRKDGYCPARKLRHDFQWEAYLAHGGDPQAMIEGVDERPELPLWRYLVDQHSHESAGKAAGAWAKAHMGDAMKQKLYNDYWAKLRERAKYTVGTGEIPSLVRSHEEYLTLRDPQGRVVPMYVIQMHGSAYKNLQQKQYQQLNKQRDDNGHSLWHYALSRGRTFSSDTMKFLLEAGAPLDPNPKTGRGLIPSMLLDFEHMQGPYDLYPRDPQAVSRWLKKTTGEQWWAAQDGDWDRLREALKEAMKNKDVAATLGYIACEFIEHIPDAALRDELMEQNLQQPSRNINVEGVRKYFELGHADAWSEEKVQALRHKLGEDSFAQVRAIHQARTMQGEVVQVQAPRKGPRL